MTGQVRLREQAKPRDPPAPGKLMPLRLPNSSKPEIDNNLSKKFAQTREVAQWRGPLTFQEFSSVFYCLFIKRIARNFRPSFHSAEQTNEFDARVIHVSRLQCI